MNFPEEMKPYDDAFWEAAEEHDIDGCLESRYSMDVSATQAESFFDRINLYSPGLYYWLNR